MIRENRPKAIVLTPRLEHLLSLALEGLLTGDPLDPELTELVMAGLLEETHAGSGRLQITELGRARLRREPED